MPTIHSIANPAPNICKADDKKSDVTCPSDPKTSPRSYWDRAGVAKFFRIFNSTAESKAGSANPLPVTHSGSTPPLGPLGTTKNSSSLASQNSTCAQYTNAIESLLDKSLDKGQKSIVQKNIRSEKALNNEGLERALKALHIDAKNESLPVSSDLIARINAAKRVLVTIETTPPHTELYTKQADGSWAKQAGESGTTTTADSPGGLVQSLKATHVNVLKIRDRPSSQYVSVPNPRNSDLSHLKTDETDKTTFVDWYKQGAENIKKGEELLEKKDYLKAKECFETALDSINKYSAPNLLQKYQALENLSVCMRNTEDTACFDTYKEMITTLQKLAASPPQSYTAKSIKTTLANIYHNLADVYQFRSQKADAPPDAAKMAKRHFELAISTRKDAGPDIAAAKEQAESIASLIAVKKSLGENDLDGLEQDLAEFNADPLTACENHITDGKALFNDNKPVEARKCFEMALDAIETMVAPDPFLKYRVLYNLSACMSAQDPAYINTCTEKATLLQKLVDSPPMGRTPESVKKALAHVYHALGNTFQSRMTKADAPSDTGQKAKQYFELSIRTRKEAGPEAAQTETQADDIASLIDVKKSLGDNDVRDLELDLLALRADLARKSQDIWKAVGAYEEIVNLTKDGGSPDLQRALKALTELRRIHIKYDHDAEYVDVCQQQIKILNKLVEDKSLPEDDVTNYWGDLAHVHVVLARCHEKNADASTDLNKVLIEDHLDNAIKARRKTGASFKPNLDYIDIIQKRRALFPEKMQPDSPEYQWKASLEKELKGLIPKIYPRAITAELHLAKTIMEGFQDYPLEVQNIKKNTVAKSIARAKELETELRSYAPLAYAQALRARADFIRDVMQGIDLGTETEEELRRQANELA